jgi:predicted alpha/beta-fold hydrolase
MLTRNPIYDRYFVRRLVEQVGQLQRANPDVPRQRFPRKMTLRNFDEIYTAPRGGFRDAMDYYHQAAPLPLMDDIRIPTFVLTAADDPFVDVSPFRELPAKPQREIHIAERGGHLGFLGWDGAGGVRWAERQLAEWLLATARR